jgi:hypothetical protein
VSGSGHRRCGHDGARNFTPPKGDERLSGSNQAEPGEGEHAGMDSGEAGKGGKVAAKKKPSGRPADVGRALRSVYDDTLREDIPSDLKDLLGRLG